MNIENFLRLHSTSSCGSLYRPCGTMSLPGTQPSLSADDVCGVVSAATCSVAAAIDSTVTAAGGSATSFHHGVMYGSGIIPRPSSPGGLAGSNLLHRHGYVGHPMSASGIVLPHHPSTGRSVAPHHLLSSPFVAAAHTGQMNALTLAERLAGESSLSQNLPA